MSVEFASDLAVDADALREEVKNKYRVGDYGHFRPAGFGDGREVCPV